MKYKYGDKVRVKYGLAKEIFKEVDAPYGYNSDRDKFIGKVVTILHDDNYYEIMEQPDILWTDEMFEDPMDLKIFRFKDLRGNRIEMTEKDLEEFIHNLEIKVARLSQLVSNIHDLSK